MGPITVKCLFFREYCHVVLLGSSILLLLVITNLQSLLELNSCQGGWCHTVLAGTVGIYLSDMCTGTET